MRVHQAETAGHLLYRVGLDKMQELRIHIHGEDVPYHLLVAYHVSN